MSVAWNGFTHLKVSHYHCRNLWGGGGGVQYLQRCRFPTVDVLKWNTLTGRAFLIPKRYTYPYPVYKGSSPTPPRHTHTSWKKEADFRNTCYHNYYSTLAIVCGREINCRPFETNKKPVHDVKVYFIETTFQRTVNSTEEFHRNSDLRDFSLSLGKTASYMY